MLRLTFRRALRVRGGRVLRLGFRRWRVVRLSRRMLGRRRRRVRDVAGNNDAVDMALCVARFSRKWSQLGVKKRR